MGKKIKIEKLLKEITHIHFFYDEKTHQVKDDLSERIQSITENTFYYIGVTDFVDSYFKNNPDTEWNLSGIYQIGFPYTFPAGGIIDEKTNSVVTVSENHPGLEIRKYLKNRSWYLFVFTKNYCEKTIISFNNSNNCKLLYRGNDKSEERVFCVLSEEK